MISRKFPLNSPLLVAPRSVTTGSPAISRDEARPALLPVHRLRRWLGLLARPLFGLASVAIAALFLIHAFGLRQVAAEVSRTEFWPMLGAVLLGAAVQVARAQRARLLLGGRHPVSLSHSFAAMVVGHGIGDLVPVAPGGPVLRSVLTERLARVPVAFSGGVYMVEGALDVMVPAILIPYLLVAVSLPAWTRWVLVGVLAQATVLLALLVVLAIYPRIRSGHRLPSLSAPRLMHLVRQVADGLRALGAGGPRRLLTVVGLSLLVLTLTAAQVTLFLGAFDMTAPATGLALLLVLMLSSGSIPVKIPGFGTITAAAALPIAGIHGADVGGYLLTSQFLLSSETLALAILVLGWWFVRRNRHVGSAGNALGVRWKWEARHASRSDIEGAPNAVPPTWSERSRGLDLRARNDDLRR